MKLFKTLCFAALLASFGSAYAQTGSTSLRNDVATLMQDVKADVANSDVTAAEVQSLQSAIEAIVSVAHKPSQASVEQLQSLIQEVRAAGSATSAQKAELRAALWNVVASAGIPASDVSALKEAVSDIYFSSNFNQAERIQLVDDIKAILCDLPGKN